MPLSYDEQSIVRRRYDRFLRYLRSRVAREAPEDCWSKGARTNLRSGAG